MLEKRIVYCFYLGHDWSQKCATPIHFSCSVCPSFVFVWIGGKTVKISWLHSFSVHFFSLVRFSAWDQPERCFLSFSIAIHIFFYTVEAFVVALQLIFAFNSSFMCIENVNLSRFYAIRFLYALVTYIDICVCLYLKIYFLDLGFLVPLVLYLRPKSIPTPFHVHSFPVHSLFIRFVAVRLPYEFAHHISVTFFFSV